MNQRISELLHDNLLSERTLRQLILGGFVRVSDLLKQDNLTEAEKDYLYNNILLEESELKENLLYLKKRGIDIGKLIRDYRIKIESPTLSSL